MSYVSLNQKMPRRGLKHRNGKVRVCYNSFQGYWTFEVQPTVNFYREHPGAHPECMFVPCDTKEEAILEATEFAVQNAMKVEVAA